MFRKVNKLINGKSRGRDRSGEESQSSPPIESKVEQLQSMGFDRIQSQNALEATNGDLEEAMNHLLTNQSVLDQQSDAVDNSNGNSTNATATGSDRHRSAASIRAGQAAASRAQNNPYIKNTKSNRKKPSITSKLKPSSVASAPRGTTTMTNNFKAQHPNVQMPPKLSSKTKEEQILRCTNRLASHPFAVDTLLHAFSSIQKSPDNEKFRKIDTSSAGYKKVLEGKPGALDLIHAMNFVERGGDGSGRKDLILIKEKIDPALLYLGISALEQTRLSKEYLDEKSRVKFEKEVEGILNGQGASEELELIARAEFLAKVPSEPAKGAGARMQVTIGSEKLSRRFDGDDVVQDVVHWLGAHGSQIPERIISREWSLVDLNRYPIVAVDVEGNLDRTLQFIGCWPSGRLGIVASTKEWKEGKVMKEDMGSSRGLGAAPSSIVN